MVPALLIIAGMTLIAAFMLSIAARIFGRGNEELVIEKINLLLPQTQCGQCNYAGCRPYAAAIASGDAQINQCPPGGKNTIENLARLLGRPALPLNPANGEEKEARVAFIHEDICIGCKKCIQACPVDAILGAAKRMHTVIAHECTGCDLCVEPCPVDCIDMIPNARTAVVQAREKPAAVHNA